MQGGVYMPINGISQTFSLRNLNRTNQLLNKQFRKLTTLQRITSAADDAAGLAIAQRMAGQISGTTQAQYNVQDVTSAVQVAEGGLEQISSMQQRLRDLAVQAANGTLTDADREMINTEAQQLTQEIDRMAGTVEFNQQPLLSGQFAQGTGALTAQAGANEGETIDVNIEAVDTTALGLNNIDLSTQAGAQQAIGHIDQSINTVSAQRANLGAFTNRLESTYNFLGIQNENQQASFSQIMDADVALEMTRFTSQSLLQNIGMSMFAQGNLIRQNVLNLFNA